MAPLEHVLSSRRTVYFLSIAKKDHILHKGTEVTCIGFIINELFLF